MENEVLQDKREKRSPILIANFIDGYADGWRFAVRQAFKDALDIKWTTKVINKIESYEWTQGTQFNFSPGDIIYDTRLAYDLKWSDALKHIKLSIQITETTPSGSVKFKLYRPQKDLRSIEQIDTIECSQTEFVSFLKTGLITINGNNSRNLFEEYNF